MYAIEQLKEAIKDSECWSDVCRKLNITICTFNYKRMHKLSSEHGINYSHFDVKKTFRRNKTNWTSEEVYTEKSTFSRTSLRRRVIKDNFMQFCCHHCGNGGEWMGSKLTLEIEHVNGINDDNRKENLKWLCPNCHSQTPTYRCSTNRRGCSIVAIHSAHNR